MRFLYRGKTHYQLEKMVLQQKKIVRHLVKIPTNDNLITFYWKLLNQ